MCKKSKKERKGKVKEEGIRECDKEPGIRIGHGFLGKMRAGQEEKSLSGVEGEEKRRELGQDRTYYCRRRND